MLPPDEKLAGSDTVTRSPGESANEPSTFGEPARRSDTDQTPEFAGYQVEFLAGRGGMGRVYAARDRQLGRRVALKCLIDPDSDATLRRFVDEAKAGGSQPPAKSARDKRSEANLDLVADDAAEEQDREWTFAWQRSVLNHTWARIDEDDRRTAAAGKSNSAIDVLQLRIAHPDVSTAELTELLSKQWKTAVTPDNCRQLLSRTRKRFAAVLVDEVRAGLDDESDERLQEELAELKLLEWLGDSK